MKQYFITVDYTQSNLSAMERDLIDQAKPFNRCLIMVKRSCNQVVLLQKVDDAERVVLEFDRKDFLKEE